MSQPPRLLVMAGGTGGHIFPALAVADALVKQGWEVEWLGTADRMEATLVPQYGIKLHCIEVSGIKGKGLLSLLKAPWMVIKAVLQAKRVIEQVKPNVILGMGGYVSGPGGFAAYLTKTPFLIHEQNGVAGLTNKWLSKFATVVMQAFDTAFDTKFAKVVGNPVRSSFMNLPAPNDRYLSRTGKLSILVVGGSQGAQILNHTIPGVAAQLKDKAVFRHQVGKGNQAKVAALYDALGVHDVIVDEFIDDIEKAYVCADLIICRSGALTVSELAAVGAPAIFVPFKHKDNQQKLNAKWLADVGAAFIIEQDALNIDELVKLIAPLDRQQLLEMANIALTRSNMDATHVVASKLIEIKK